MDLLLLGTVIGLTLFGLAMIASVSVFKSYQLTQNLVNQGLLDAPSNAFFLKRSAMHVVISFSVMMIAASIPYRLWQRYARLLFLATVAMLIAVFLPGLRN